jgi:hypothetical protein
MCLQVLQYLNQGALQMSSIFPPTIPAAVATDLAATAMDAVGPAATSAVDPKSHSC